MAPDAAPGADTVSANPDTATRDTARPPDTAVPDAAADRPIDTAVDTSPDTLRANGSMCANPEDCQSGFCASAVCCESACTDVCMACDNAGSQGSCRPRPPGALIGWWKLDDGNGSSAMDSSCGGNDGTLRDFAASGWQAGMVGGALAFDGTATWVKVPGNGNRLSAPAASNAFTVAAWVRLAAHPNTYQVVISRQYDTGYYEHFNLGLGDYQAFFNINSQDAASGSCTDPAAAPLDTWLHLAATFDGGTGRVYRDGQQVCSFTYSGKVLADTTPVVIGGAGNDANDAAQELYAGAIDEVLYYDRALSAQEIGGIASGGTPPR